MNISTEAIEAAAEALFNRAGQAGAFDEHPLRMMYVNQSRAALEAAAPLLTAQAWDEGRAHGAMWPYGYGGLRADDNPYRKETP